MREEHSYFRLSPLIPFLVILTEEAGKSHRQALSQASSGGVTKENLLNDQRPGELLSPCKNGQGLSEFRSQVLAEVCGPSPAKTVHPLPAPATHTSAPRASGSPSQSSKALEITLSPRSI